MASPTLITPNQMCDLTSRIRDCYGVEKAEAACTKMLRTFKVARIDNLTAAQYTEALARIKQAFPNVQFTPPEKPLPPPDADVVEADEPPVEPEAPSKNACSDDLYKQIHTAWAPLPADRKEALRKQWSIGVLTDVKKWDGVSANNLLVALKDEGV